MTEKIAQPQADEKKEDASLLLLTKNQRRNLKKKKLKKKKQALKNGEIGKQQENPNEDQNEEIEVEEEKCSEKIKKPEDLNLDEAFENMEKDLVTSKAKDSTKIQFDK